MTLLEWLFPTAYAAGAQQAPASSAASSFIMLFAFLLIFYFMLWRPQSKRQKAHKELVASLQTGVEVMTHGGIIGVVKAVKDNFVDLEVASGVVIKIQKQAIASELPKGSAAAV